MTDETTNESNEEGKETNTDSTDNKEDIGKHFVSSPVIEAAKAENDRREKIIEEEKKLQDRKEKLHAEQMVGGRAMAGEEQKPETQDDRDQAEADKLLADGE